MALEDESKSFFYTLSVSKNIIINGRVNKLKDSLCIYSGLSHWGVDARLVLIAHLLPWENKSRFENPSRHNQKKVAQMIGSKLSYDQTWDSVALPLNTVHGDKWEVIYQSWQREKKRSAMCLKGAIERSTGGCSSLDNDILLEKLPCVTFQWCLGSIISSFIAILTLGGEVNKIRVPWV